MSSRVLGCGAVLLLAGLVRAAGGCGGKAVIDAESSSGGGGGTGTTTSGTPNVASTTTGGGACTTHTDCPGGVCIFSAGVCADACEPDSCEPCGTGQRCEPCATSSCENCLDCRAACIEAVFGSCDDHDDCQDGEVCVYSQGQCLPACEAGGTCANMNLVCDSCVTSSCPCCEDCGSACVFP